MKCDTISRVWIGLLTILVVIFIGVFLTHLATDIMDSQLSPQLFTAWEGDTLSVGGSDGPWLVTHLVAYHPDGFWRASAEFPKPISIVESGGRDFSPEEIVKLKWVDFGGGTQPPPKPGENIGVICVLLTRGPQSNR